MPRFVVDFTALSPQAERGLSDTMSPPITSRLSDSSSVSERVWRLRPIDGLSEQSCGS
jgi:hypothetical protein